MPRSRSTARPGSAPHVRKPEWSLGPRSYDHSPTATLHVSDVIGREHVDCCSATAVAVSDAFRAWQILHEGCGFQNGVDSLETGRFDAQVHDDINVIGGAD